jgi:hypothetical protein
LSASRAHLHIYNIDGTHASQIAASIPAGDASRCMEISRSAPVECLLTHYRYDKVHVVSF